jgi:putative ABC transport system ATP-binding protein
VGAAEMHADVSIEGLVVEYHRGGYPVRPIDDFSMTVPARTLALLLGPSGCGKTTLLSCLAGIQEPTAGVIRVGSTEVTALDPGRLTDYRRTGVGVVFQAFNLVPSLTARENVMVPMRAAGVPQGAARQKADELLAEVGLAERADHRPGSLSGGQMQRVAIARALALDPPLIVADEPTASLDHVQVETVLRILRRLTQRGRTVVVSTHDHRLLPLADMVIDMAPEHSTDLTPSKVVEYAAGDEVFAEGSDGTRIYRVERGAVELTRGGEHLHTARDGEVFGEMGPLFSLPRSARAVAVEPSTLTAFTVDGFTAEFGGEELRRLVARFDDN